MFMPLASYVIFSNMPSFRRVSKVSQNIVRALIPAVRAPFVDAVFAFCSFEKAASTQKNPQHYRLTLNRFKIVVNALTDA